MVLASWAPVPDDGVDDLVALLKADSADAVAVKSRVHSCGKGMVMWGRSTVEFDKQSMVTVELATISANFMNRNRYSPASRSFEHAAVVEGHHTVVDMTSPTDDAQEMVRRSTLLEVAGWKVGALLVVAIRVELFD